jgi:cell wall-associated NlpC family hydrolase
MAGPQSTMGVPHAPTVKWSQGGGRSNVKKTQWGLPDAQAPQGQRPSVQGDPGFAPTATAVVPKPSVQPQEGWAVPGMGPASSTGIVSKAIQSAMAQIGDPYVWGAGRDYGNKNPSSFDCSGLTSWSYAQAGVRIPGTADAQYRGAKLRSGGIESYKPGDLVFFSFGRLGSGRADHVGIYLGNGQFIQAPRRGSTVQVSNLSGAYASHLLGAGTY